MNLELEDLKTRTTRYMGEDGRERAVLLWEDYERLLEMAGDRKPEEEVH